MTKREEMFEKMQGVCKGGKSQLHMRSESIQDRFRMQRIPMLKKALKKKSKLLLITDLAIPFNPETGVEDDEYNVDNKFRPPFSATSVALSLKELADSNDATKEAFMRRAGVSEWDTSDYANFTTEDWHIFVKYRVPRIFTVPVVHVNIPVMTKNAYGRDFSISVERDPMTGEVIGEVPGVLKVNKFFRDKIYEEIQEYQNSLDSGEIKHTDKQQSEYKSDIWKRNPVSDVSPSNWVTLIELPLTNQYKLSADVDYEGFSADSVKGCLVLSRYAKEIRKCVESYMSGELEKFDKYLDYFEIDMGCPTEGDDQSEQGRMLMGKDTKFDKPSYQLFECMDENTLVTFKESVLAHLDDNVAIEEEVRRSMYIQPYTAEVENQIYSSLYTVLDIENDKYITQEVLKANSEVVSVAFAGVGDALLDELDAGCSDAAKGSLDEDDAKEEGRKYSISELEDDFSVDLDEVTLDSTVE